MKYLIFFKFIAVYVLSTKRLDTVNDMYIKELDSNTVEIFRDSFRGNLEKGFLSTYFTPRDILHVITLLF